MTYSRQARDAVGIYTKNYIQVLTRARIVGCQVRPTAKLMEQPLESGATIVDHRIILPITIEISAILQAADYKNTYRELKKLFLNGTTLSIQTRSDVYTNQVIGEMPHEEDPSMYDALSVGILFKQIIYASSQTTINPQNPADSTTVNRGQVSPNPGGPSSKLNGVIP